MSQDDCTCAALLLDSARAHAGTDSIVLPGDRVTYAELVGGARRWARRLIDLGVAPGDHVGLFMPNSSDFMCVLFGAMLAGAVPVPINSRYRGPEIADIVSETLSHHEATKLVTVADVLDADAEARRVADGVAKAAIA